MYPNQFCTIFVSYYYCTKEYRAVKSWLRHCQAISRHLWTKQLLDFLLTETHAALRMNGRLEIALTVCLSPARWRARSSHRVPRASICRVRRERPPRPARLLGPRGLRELLGRRRATSSIEGYFGTFKIEYSLK